MTTLHRSRYSRLQVETSKHRPGSATEPSGFEVREREALPMSMLSGSICQLGLPTAASLPAPGA